MVKIKLSTRNFIFTVVHVHQVKTLWLRPCPEPTKMLVAGRMVLVSLKGQGKGSYNHVAK